MFDTVIEKIMIHTDILKSGIKASLMILKSAKEKNLDQIEFWTENRERIIASTSQKQRDVEQLLNNLPQEEATKENMDVVRTWFDDTQNWIQAISNIDEEIVTALSDQKDQMTREIASTHKTKQVFSGYNLKSVSK